MKRRFLYAAGILAISLGAVLAPTGAASADQFSTVSLRVAANVGQEANVQGGSVADGTPLIQWALESAPNSAWNLVPTDSGYYVIQGVQSRKCVDVQGASTGDGARVIIWPCHGGDNQQWRFAQSGNGYLLIARHSQKCLNVAGGLGQGRVLIQWPCVGLANDVWLPVGEPNAA